MAKEEIKWETVIFVDSLRGVQVEMKLHQEIIQQ